VPRWVSFVHRKPVNSIDPSGHTSAHQCETGQAGGYACENVGKQMYWNWYGQVPACTFKKTDQGFCKLANGAVIDLSHLNVSGATQFWTDLSAYYTAYLEGGPAIVNIRMPSQTTPGNQTFFAKYTVDFTNIGSWAMLRRVGAGIYWDYQVRFERWEAEQVWGLGGRISGFRNEDIPSTYLGYVAAVSGEDIAYIAFIAGGGNVVQGKAVASDWDVDAQCVQEEICGSSTARNNTIYMKVKDASGNWVLLSYPRGFPVPLSGSVYFQYQKCFSTFASSAGCQPIK
jgi:hypothetical protein